MSSPRQGFVRMALEHGVPIVPVPTQKGGKRKTVSRIGVTKRERASARSPFCLGPGHRTW